ncbi:MAG: 2-phospho-L-lactate guanylyltransferase [Chloroflexi bacterium]|nr:2-phospho-L-lactate guanylyltransferase [Chloroflexota bacterium]
MKLWAVIPVKPFQQGKSRLTAVLREEQRSQLNQILLENTLTIVGQAAHINNIVVISRDSKVLDTARAYTQWTIYEQTSQGLNAALSTAAQFVVKQGGDQICVLPTDLPLLTSGDVDAFVSLANEEPEIVIAPDRKRDGTNALLMNPVGVIPFSFGRKSFTRHLEHARLQHARSAVYEKPSMGFDLDLPEDLEWLKLNNPEDRLSERSHCAEISNLLKEFLEEL